MFVKCLVVAISVLAMHGTTFAESLSCNDVVQEASVYYPPSASVTVVSSKTKHYCRFSIDGTLADKEPPPAFKKMTGSLQQQQLAMLRGDISALDVIPRLTFAADEKIIEAEISEFLTLLKDNSQGIQGCYASFYKGGEGVCISC